MKRPTRIVLAAITTAAALALAGCGASSGSSSSSGSGPVEGGNLTIARAGDALSLNNTTTFDNNSIYVMEQIGEPLFTVSSNGQTVKPWLATGYTISSDKLTYTIQLRKGVKFSDGKPMTAADVVFSINQDTASGATGWGWINSAISTVTAVNPSTVQIKLKYAWAPLLADLSLFANDIVPDNYGGKTETAFYDAPIGTGPYKWDVWKKGQYLKLTKNTDYWQKGKPYLDSITWTVVPNSNTRKLQVQGGQADIDDTPDWSSYQSLQSTPGINAVTFPSTQINYVMFNEKIKPFQDPKVRQAIAYAIDRQALVKAVLYGHGTAANSLLAPGVPYYDKNADGPTYDLAKAKSLMAASTEPNGFSTTLLTASGDPNQAAVAQIMQAELKKLNINVTISQLDPTANKQARESENYDMALSLWTMDIPDPDEWTSFAVDPSGGADSAFTHYSNPTVIALDHQAEQEVNPTKRAALYDQLQKITGQDAFLAYLYYSPFVYAVSDKVHGFAVTPLGNYHLEDVYKTK